MDICIVVALQDPLGWALYNYVSPYCGAEGWKGHKTIFLKLSHGPVAQKAQIKMADAH